MDCAATLNPFYTYYAVRRISPSFHTEWPYYALHACTWMGCEMSVNDRDLVAYVLSRLGCTHPFTISRVAALAELLSLERRGARITDLRYIKGPGVFFIEGLKESIEGDPCFKIREGDPSTGRRGCIEYRCDPPELPREVARLIDDAIARACGLNDYELNNLIMNHPLFERLVRG